MRIDLPGQAELILPISHSRPVISGFSKEELGVRLATLLRKYDDRPSSGLWIEIQETAKEVLK